MLTQQQMFYRWSRLVRLVAQISPAGLFTWKTYEGSVSLLRWTRGGPGGTRGARGDQGDQGGSRTDSPHTSSSGPVQRNVLVRFPLRSPPPRQNFWSTRRQLLGLDRTGQWAWRMQEPWAG